MSKQIKNILITDDVDAKSIEIFENNGFLVTKNTKLSKDELKEEIKKYDCLIVRSATKVTSEIIASAGNSLKLIGRAGTGVDNIDVDAATANQTLVMNTPGSNTISAAELTCAMLSSLARFVPQANQSMKEGKWERTKFVGTELFGKTLAIIGLGRIGKEVAYRMNAFGMKCIGYDPIVTAEQAAKSNIEFKTLEEIWPLADYITIHVPLMPETENLISKAVISKCKPGFKVINCARGGIIHEADLLEALMCGKCGGAGLDVYREEPPTKELELLKHPNVICTPHLGASTKEAQNRVAIDLASQIVNYVKQNVLEGGVNAHKLNK